MPCSQRWAGLETFWATSQHEWLPLYACYWVKEPPPPFDLWYSFIFSRLKFVFIITYCLFPQLMSNYRLQPHPPSLQFYCLLQISHLHMFRSIVFNLLPQIPWFLPFTQVNRSRINCTGIPEVRYPKEGDFILTVPRGYPYTKQAHKYYKPCLAQGLSQLSLVRPASGTEFTYYWKYGNYCSLWCSTSSWIII